VAAVAQLSQDQEEAVYVAEKSRELAQLHELQVGPHERSCRADTGFSTARQALGGAGLGAA
jgi:hypothetical protein